MINKVPTYIFNEIIDLSNNMYRVRKSLEVIRRYATSQIGAVETNHFFDECQMDNPYEFDIERTFAAIEEIANYDYC